MPQFVRVKDKETGHHLSILRSQYEADGGAQVWEELADHPATDNAGDPLPPKYKTTVSAETEKTADPSAATSKKGS